VGNVQAIGQTAGLDGPTKLKVATAQIKSAILASSLMVGHEIDSAALDLVAGEYAQATVDLLKGLKPSTRVDVTTFDSHGLEHINVEPK